MKLKCGLAMILACGVLVTCLALNASAADIMIAAASDLNFAFKELAAEYEKTSDNHVKLSLGSSGNFFSQIQNGAPFDLYFSADIGYPKKLEEAGYVSRERDPRDRRRVVVTLSLDHAMRNVASVFLPIMRDWRELATGYTDDELRLIVDFYARMEQVFRNHLIRLRTEDRDG